MRVGCREAAHNSCMMTVDAHEAAAEVLHFRSIEMQGSRRADGLFAVEGRLTDRKTHAFGPNVVGRLVQPMQPMHLMGVRIVFDDTLSVVEIGTFTEMAPYPACGDGGAALQSLVGLRMTSGWGKEVRGRLDGARSCTHLRELLVPLATVAFQTLSELRIERWRQSGTTPVAARVDSCYAWAADGDVVQRHLRALGRPAS